MPGVTKPLLAKDNVSYCVPAMSQETLLLQELLYCLLWIVGQHMIDLRFKPAETLSTARRGMGRSRRAWAT